jgi:hypothetical protein
VAQVPRARATAFTIAEGLEPTGHEAAVGGLHRAHRHEVDAGADGIDEASQRHGLHARAAIGVGEEREEDGGEVRLGASTLAPSGRALATSAVNVETWLPMVTRSGVVATRLANCRRARSISSSYPAASARPVRHVSMTSSSASTARRGGSPMLAVLTWTLTRLEFLLRVSQTQHATSSRDAR